MLDFIEQKYQCTGCSACVNICPKSCIALEKDEEGFLYPVVDDNCIHCGLCKKICPKINPIEGSVDIEQLAFACKSKNHEIWKTSSSGGAFSEICKCFGDDNTLIVGAAYDGLKVKHLCVRGVDNILPLRKSKYVASDPGCVFSVIKKELLNGGKVIFCGTPCQVAGLKAILKNIDTRDLLLIDFVCHGVGSQTVWKECINFESKKYKKKIVQYLFRNKEDVFEERYIQKLTFEDGTSISVKNDAYQVLFLNQLCLRPSCGENCPYRNKNRLGDITLADYKNPQLDFEKNSIDLQFNYTAIVFNTKKSSALLKTMLKSTDMFSSSLDNIKRDNPLFFGQTKSNRIERDYFFNMFKTNPEKAIKVFTKKHINKKWNFKSIICRLLKR